MPINTIQNLIHIRTNKNKQVMSNVVRLREISRHSLSSQDILDALHPWGKNNELKFHNVLPKICIFFSFSSFIIGWLFAQYFPFNLSVLITIFWFSIAYFSYESNEPIDEIIDELELKIKLMKYHLNFQKLPPHLTSTMNSALVLAKLKQNFPLFNQGNLSNDIISFASTLWTDENANQHSVLLFKYNYVTEMHLQNPEGKKYTVHKMTKDLWGGFIFETKPLGFAVSNRRNKLPHPYTSYWATSDITLNKKLNIYGYDQQQIAKTISPSMTLKLSDFFNENHGDLIIHYEENILCYMGEQNIFATDSRRDKNNIQNISELRGYLRTLNMPNYEKFKQSMLNFIA